MSYKMLNTEQKEFFYHILHLIKTSDEPFYCLLSCGAGVHFGKWKVLLLAPSGKATYDIKDNTCMLVIKQLQTSGF